MRAVSPWPTVLSMLTEDTDDSLQSWSGPRRRRSERTREALCQAALVISAQGVEATS